MRGPGFAVRSCLREGLVIGRANLQRRLAESQAGSKVHDPDGTTVAVQQETVEKQIPGYELLGILGEGGMGTVGRARHIATGRIVAIKHLRGCLSTNDEDRSRFRREAALCREIQHPGLIRLLDFQFDGDMPYLVFDLVEGESLADIIAREGSLSPIRAIDLLAQLAEAVGVLHAAGIVHRDLKPANVIVRPGDQVCLLDFGVAKHFGDAVRTMDDLTQAGMVLGTVAYIPLDAFAGAPHPTHDVWALGVLLFELCIGERPFDGKEFDGVVAFLDRLRAGEFPTPSSRVRGIPTAVDDVFTQLTALDPHGRPENGAAAAVALRKVQSGLVGGGDRSTVHAPARPRSGRTPSLVTKPVSMRVVAPPPPRSNVRALGVGLGMVLLAAGVVVIWTRSSQPPLPIPSPTPTASRPAPPSPLAALTEAVKKAGSEIDVPWLRKFADNHRAIIKTAPETVSIALRAHLERLGVLAPLLACSKADADTLATNSMLATDSSRILADLELIECFCVEKKVPLPWGSFSVAPLVSGPLSVETPSASRLRTARSWVRAGSSKANRYFPGRSWTDTWTIPTPDADERVLVWFALMRWRTGLVLDVRVNGKHRRLMRWNPPSSDPGPITVPAVEYINENGQPRRDLTFSILSEEDRAGLRSYLGFSIPRELSTPRLEVEIQLVDLPLSLGGMRDPELATRIVSLVKTPTH